jgi:ATP-dependent Lon protease
MPRRYNLRKRDPSVKWIEDDTLKPADEEESEDEDYIPEEDEEEPDEEIEEDEEDEEAEPEEEAPVIRVPILKNSRIKIEIDNRPRGGYDDEDDLLDEEEDDEDMEEEVPAGGFLGYLMNKYVPSSRLKKSKAKADDDGESPALDLNDDEQEYYEDLPKSKKRKLNKQMKQVATLVHDGDVPYKFRVLEMPISDSLKATVIKKLDQLDRMDGDDHKLRAWVDGFLRIPFGTNVPLPVKLDDGPKPCAEFLGQTRKTLDKAVYGMQGAKTQIMQILAQWISNPRSVGNVIALRGPMGVGKTSFARNGIATVLNRPFEFFSLGGASDSANFVGHSFTYEGSMWGRIADSLMTARCMNPVMYFDELDKVSETAHGQEIVSMLIHMTDRSQNSQFHDRYFAGVDFDLSQCLFVFSYNDESKIHPVLRDRMQVIQCNGYSAAEKTIILTQYVVPQILDRTKLTDVTFSDESIRFLINEYSKEEEGVRTLMRAVESLVTRINLLRIADEETAKSYTFYTKISLPLTITSDIAKHILQDLSATPNESWRHLYV